MATTLRLPGARQHDPARLGPNVLPKHDEKPSPLAIGAGTLTDAASAAEAALGLQGAGCRSPIFRAGRARVP